MCQAIIIDDHQMRYPPSRVLPRNRDAWPPVTVTFVQQTVNCMQTAAPAASPRRPSSRSSTAGCHRVAHSTRNSDACHSACYLSQQGRIAQTAAPAACPVPVIETALRGCQLSQSLFIATPCNSAAHQQGNNLQHGLSSFRGRMIALSKTLCISGLSVIHRKRPQSFNSCPFKTILLTGNS